MIKSKIRNPKTDGEDIDTEKDFEEHEDLMAVRVVEVEDRSFKVHQKNPYALWYIQTDRGPVPKALEGSFTSPHEAEKALKRYMGTPD